MNRTLLLPFLLTALLGVPARAQAPRSAADAVFGAYQRVPADLPVVQEARDFLKSRMVSLSLGETSAAYVQVVDGTNVKMVCDVVEEGRAASWKLVAYKSLDGHWHLWSAERL